MPVVDDWLYIECQLSAGRDLGCEVNIATSKGGADFNSLETKIAL